MKRIIRLRPGTLNPIRRRRGGDLLLARGWLRLVLVSAVVVEFLLDATSDGQAIC
jgi:hypothetical protein